MTGLALAQPYQVTFMDAVAMASPVMREVRPVEAEAATLYSIDGPQAAVRALIQREMNQQLLSLIEDIHDGEAATALLGESNEDDFLPLGEVLRHRRG